MDAEPRDSSAERYFQEPPVYKQCRVCSISFSTRYACLTLFLYIILYLSSNIAWGDSLLKISCRYVLKANINKTMIITNGMKNENRAASSAAAAARPPSARLHSGPSHRQPDPVQCCQQTPLGRLCRRDPRPPQQQARLARNHRHRRGSLRRLRCRPAYDAAGPEFRGAEAMTHFLSPSQIRTLDYSSSTTTPPPPPPPDLTLSFPVSRPVLRPFRRSPPTPESGDVPLYHGVLHVVLPSPMEPPYLGANQSPHSVVCTRLPSSLSSSDASKTSYYALVNLHPRTNLCMHAEEAERTCCTSLRTAFSEGQRRLSILANVAFFSFLHG
ncbi:hypothetical protein Fmac_005211 [Flemingia macrophylla]|uniref:Uncharacterized protein n=1 Tax=Flemingia macrophylla TaxID=520843 RepID=A0ABD1N753_9FABA